MGTMAGKKGRLTEDARDESCREEVQHWGVAPDSLAPGIGGVAACLTGVVAQGSKGTPSPKICLKLPCMFLALATSLGN